MVKPQDGIRISKTDTYLNCAETFAYRSTCVKRKYGAVIVKDDVVISTGYNGCSKILVIELFAEAEFFNDVQSLKIFLSFILYAGVFGGLKSILCHKYRF